MAGRGFCIFQTALGKCALAWGDSGVTAFGLPEASEAALRKRFAGLEESEPPVPIRRLIVRVQRHLEGNVDDFRDVQLDLGHVTPFFRAVYEAARAIPPGSTATYGEIAKRLGKPGASRAVGQALGKNPIGLIVPCHRVMASGNRPGGFSAHGGIGTKVRMLAIEGWHEGTARGA